MRRYSVAGISEELSIHVITFSKWSKAWQLQRELVPASKEDPKGRTATDKLTVLLESAGLSATKLSANCSEQGL